jgi:hypothetical protein
MSRCLFLSLPEELLRWITNFICPSTKGLMGLVPINFDLRPLLACNKSLRELQKRIRILLLNKKTALTFNDNVEFRQRVLQSVLSPHLQISVNCPNEEFIKRMYGQKHLDLSPFDGVYSLTLRGCTFKTASPFRVTHLTLTNCGSMDLSCCSSSYIESLDISAAFYVGGPSVIDLAPLIHLKELRCSNYQVYNYHLLSNLQSVSITDSVSLTDVSCFQNVPVLDFSCCPNITDVSSLDEACKLNLYSCRAVKDVSALGNVHWLNLSSTAVEDVSALGNVCTLDLSYCFYVEDISQLTNVYSLKIGYFRGRNLSGLKNIRILNLSYCTTVTDLSPIANTVEELVLYNSTSITDITMLHCVKKLDISLCLGIHKLNGLFALEELTMTSGETPFTIESGFQDLTKLRKLSVQFIKPAEEVLALVKRNSLDEFIVNSGDYLKNYFPFLLKTKYLTILGSTNVRVIPQLPLLRSLVIDECPYFSQLPVLPALGSLVIRSCHGLKKFVIEGREGLFPIYYMEVDNCINLRVLIPCRRIVRLKIVSCRYLSEVKNMEMVLNASADNQCPIVFS